MGDAYRPIERKMLYSAACLAMNTRGIGMPMELRRRCAAFGADKGMGWCWWRRCRYRARCRVEQEVKVRELERIRKKPST